MGLRVVIHRGEYHSQLNVFDAVDELTLVNVPGDSDPSAEAPAARLVPGFAGGDMIVVPDVSPEGLVGPMAGGTFVMPPDALRGWPHGIKAPRPIPLYDRFETKAQYEEFSR